LLICETSADLSSTRSIRVAGGVAELGDKPEQVNFMRYRPTAYELCAFAIGAISGLLTRGELMDWALAFAFAGRAFGVGSI